MFVDAVKSSFEKIGLCTAVLALGFLSSQSAQAEDKVPDYLKKPGFMAVLVPAADNGQSITIKTEANGMFSICGSPNNPSTGEPPPPTLCTQQITTNGWTIPPEYLMKSSGLSADVKMFFKLLSGAGLIATSDLTSGIVAQTGAAVSQIVSPDPLGTLEDDKKAAHMMRMFLNYTGEANAKGDDKTMIPVATLSLSYAEIVQYLTLRVNQFSSDCDKHPDVPGSICDQAKENVRNWVNCEHQEVEAATPADLANLSAGQAAANGMNCSAIPKTPLPKDQVYNFTTTTPAPVTSPASQ